MADNFGTCFDCKGHFQCFTEVVRTAEPACRLHSMHPACQNMEVEVGGEIFALCPCGQRGDRAWFKVVAGQVPIPALPAPPLVPGHDVDFDPQEMARGYGG
ncbi:unnamed protein product [Allacma fusca]|uniref:Uncharacterized protein n=1 Tax=Allacma fusca TaxID=39272 RepID=A0A8J2KA16_9HEXA|nr:unnamed protein product [Allacma fusca]